MPEFVQPDRKRHPDGVHRDNWKRPIYHVPDEPEAVTKCGWGDDTGRHGCNAHVPGRPFQRVTTFIDVLEEKIMLRKWEKRNVAIGLAMNDHLVLKVAGAINPQDPHENKAAINAIVEDAEKAAKSSRGRDIGTALHQLTERLDRGEEAIVPEAFTADIAAYRALAEAHKLNWADVEISVVIDGVSPTKTAKGIGGRFDRIVDHWLDAESPWPCPQCGKTRRVVDLKTSQWDLEDWGPGKTAMQLCCYAIAKRYDPETGGRFDLDVCQCAAYAIHMPAGRGEAKLLRADLVKARAQLAVAYQVWQARQEAEGILNPVTLPVDGATSISSGRPPADHIHGLIAMAGDRAALAAIWEQFGPNGTNEWTNGHQFWADRRLAQLEGRAS